MGKTGIVLNSGIDIATIFTYRQTPRQEPDVRITLYTSIKSCGGNEMRSKGAIQTLQDRLVKARPELSTTRNFHEKRL